MESTSTLKGKVALVTGASRGIGLATARMLASDGATVLLNGHGDPGQLRERADEIRRESGADAYALPFDVGDPAAVKEAYAELFKTRKQLDILVNNAGVMDSNVLGMVLPDAIERTLRVNVEGVILNMQYATRLMARRGGGCIVNVSSIVGRLGSPGQIVYSASKAAVIGVTMAAAKEFAPQNIRVNAVAPGFIDTDLTRQWPPEKRQQIVQTIGFKRAGTVEDVAGVIAFLVSDPARYVTGQVIGVDGGMVL